MPKKYLKSVGIVAVYGFAAVGFFLTGGFIAVKFHLTDSLGSVDFNDRYLAQSAQAVRQLSEKEDRSGDLAKNLCRARLVKKLFPENGSKIISVYQRSQSDLLLAKMLASAELYLSGEKNYLKEVVACDDPASAGKILLDSRGDANVYGWINTPEWQALKEALAKDKIVIASVSKQTGVPARLIASQIVGEQMRLFHSEREVFKQVFQPLKILGNEVKFSLGVAGIKEETAKQIEVNLKNSSSPFYLGQKYEHLLDFRTDELDRERFERLINDKDHTYSYLYTALFLKQIETEWQKAGFPISDRPEILATMFNIGFDKSEPKADPQVGGSEIEINGHTYTFGMLAYEFFYSGELLDEFPY